MISKADYIRAKAWALLHDPPHKAWYITNRCKKIEGGHEKEAEHIWNEVVKDTPLQDNLDRVKEVVKYADEIAAGFDRWLLPRKPSGEVHDFINLLNIFNPEQQNSHPNPLTIDKNKIDAFVNDLNKIVKEASNEILCYHLLSASLEITWAVKGLPYGPADTQIPTHSIFDHLYATATTVNWSLTEEPSGFYIFLDIPKIQSIVSSARKAGDFWAGSWLISYLMWKLVEELVFDIGPDVLLIPTARLNPFYFQLLKRKRVGGDSFSEALLTFVKSSNTILPLVGDEDFPLIPVIPGTSSLTLPSPPILTNTPVKGSTASEIETYFLRRWEIIWKELLDELKELSTSSGKLKLATRIITKIVEENENIFSEPQLGLRVYTVDISSVYESLVKIAEGGGDSTLYLLQDFNVLKSAINELIGVVTDKQLSTILAENFPATAELKVKIKNALRTLLFYATILAFNRAKYEKDTSSISIKPAWPLTFTEKYNEEFKAEGGWTYCSVCGIEPALVKFGLERKDSVESYSKKTRDWFEKIEGRPLSDREYNELEVQFKPGEALGPLCILKRWLWITKSEVIKDHYDGIAPSNEAIALHPTRKALEPLKEHLKDRLTFIFFGLPEVDYSLIAKALGSKNIRKVIKVAEEEFRALPKDVLEQIYTSYISFLSLEKKSKSVVDISELLPKVYYAIVKGDGDSVGKLLQGKLPSQKDSKELLKAEEYANLLIRSVNLKGGRAAIIRKAAAVATKLGVTVIPSPTYISTLSRALMLTALKDAKIVKDHLGFLIYAGGDDVLALLPTETSLSCVRELRRSYWGDEAGFHKLGGLVVAAPIVYGRSFSLRYSHVMDPMKPEITQTFRLLDEVKKVKWDGFEKDSVIISRGREYVKLKLPLEQVDTCFRHFRPHTLCCVLPLRQFDALDTLLFVWHLMLTGNLSPSIAEDYLRLREAMKYANLSNDIIAYLIKRNISKADSESLLTMKLQKLGSRISDEILFHGVKLFRVLPR